jgi:sec-independent protein translocase protein TatC
MDIDDSRAPLLDHLLELRRRLMWCIGALLISFAVCFYFADRIFGFLVVPLTEAFGEGNGRLVYTKLY